MLYLVLQMTFFTAVSFPELTMPSFVFVLQSYWDDKIHNQLTFTHKLWPKNPQTLNRGERSVASFIPFLLKRIKLHILPYILNGRKKIYNPVLITICLLRATTVHMFLFARSWVFKKKFCVPLLGPCFFFQLTSGCLFQQSEGRVQNLQVQSFFF